MRPKLQFAGRVERVTMMSEAEERNRRYSITFSTPKEYKDKEGEFKGKRGNHFINVTVFANGLEAQKFVEDYIVPQTERDYTDRSIVFVDGTINTEPYVDANGEKQYPCQPTANTFDLKFI